MSKKVPTAASPGIGDSSAAVVPPVAAQPALDAFTEEALKRFSPFVFTLTTDTRECVDVSTIQEFVAKDPAVAEHFFLIDKSEAIHSFCNAAVETLLPLYQQLQGDVRGVAASLTAPDAAGESLSPAHSALVAACVHQKLASFANAREKRRLAELDAIRAAHTELVEKYMDDGLSATDAERAAVAEEEAAKAAEAAAGADEDDDPEASRAKAFVCLRGYPNTAVDVIALSRLGIQVNASLSINSNARLGIKKEDPSKQAAAAPAAGVKGGKPAAVDPKAKPDAKKAPPGGKKGDEAAVPVVLESLSTSLRKELVKLTPFSSHPFADIALWDYQAPTTCSVLAPAAGEESGSAPAKTYELAETEFSIFSAIASRVVALERLFCRFRLWSGNKRLRVVQPLVLAPSAKEEADAAAAAAREKEKVEAAAKAAAGKKLPPPPKGSKAALAADSVSPSDGPRDDSLVPPPPPALPPLPRAATELRAVPPLPLDASIPDVVRTAIDAVVGPLDSTVASDVEHLLTPRTAATDMFEKAVAQAKEDVGDYVDYVLSLLDGNTQQVCEGIRQRRAAAVVVSATPPTVRTALPPSETVVSSNGGVAYRFRSPRATELSSDLVHRLIAPHATSTVDTDLCSHEALTAAVAQVCGMSFDEAAAHLERSSGLAEVYPNVEAFNERLLQLHRGLDADLTSTAVITSGSEKSTRIVLADKASVPSDRHRSLAYWTAFQGAATWPQFLEWTDYVETEWLHYHPPPREDDEDDGPPEDELPVDEEDEEEAEDEYDDDGKLLPKKKKEKKIVLYDPEYVNVAAERQEALRRRQRLELVSRLVSHSDGSLRDEWLLARNHTAHRAHEEVDVMYPTDGCRVVVRKTHVNTSAVSCQVYPHPPPPEGDVVAFGFKCTVPQSAGASESLTSATYVVGSPVPSGVRGIIQIGDILVTLQAMVQEAHRTQTPATLASLAADVNTSVSSITAAAAPSAPSPSAPNKTPRGTKAADTAPAHTTGTSSSTPRVDSAKPPTPQTPVCSVADSPVISVSITNVAGPYVSVQFRTDQSAVTLQPQQPLCLLGFGQRHVVYVYHANSKSVVALPAARETYRSVSIGGVVGVTYQTLPASGSAEAGTETLQLQMYPDGSVASVFCGVCLLTTAGGARLVRDAAAMQTTQVVSEVAVAASYSEEKLCWIRLREDGVSLFDFDDGRRVVEFADGTVVERKSPASSTASSTVFTLPRPYPVVSVRAGEMTLHDDTERFQASWKPNVQLAIASVSTGFYAVVPLRKPQLLHVLPRADASTEYLIDLLYGGLRVEDGTHCFHATAFGDCRVRLVAEEHAPPPTDLTVKHKLEVFCPSMQYPSGAFAKVMADRFGSSSLYYAPLQLLPRLPLLAEAQRHPDIHVLSRPVLTTADGKKMRHTAEALSRASSVQSTNATASGVSPTVLLASPHSAVELLSCDTRAQRLRSALASGDLVQSGVVEGADCTMLVVADRVSYRQRLYSELQSFQLVRNCSQSPLWVGEGRGLQEFVGLVTAAGPAIEAASVAATAEPPRTAALSAVTSFSKVFSSSTTVGCGTEIVDALFQQLPLAEQAAAHIPRTSPATSDHAPFLDSDLLSQRAHIVNQHAVLRKDLSEQQAMAGNYWRNSTHIPAPFEVQTKVAANQPGRQHPAGDRNPASVRSTVRDNEKTHLVSSKPHHANPVPGSPVHMGTIPSTSSRTISKHRLVVTPAAVDFGTVMHGFRYTLRVDVTNVSTTTTRYRIVIPSECAAWLSVEQPRLPIAAGMSVAVVFEISGMQPVGTVEAQCSLLHEGQGCVIVPLSVSTRGPDARPISQQSRGVRLVGPTPLAYIPGSTTNCVSFPKLSQDDDDD